MTIAEALKSAEAQLEGISHTPRLDAEVLLAFAMHVSHEHLLSHDNDTMPDQDSLRFFGCVQRRATGEPVAYIRGFKEFYGREFLVNSHVLIPRPETELLIDAAIAVLSRRTRTARHVLPSQPGSTASVKILDVGTGSGCIPITLKKEIPEAKLTATEISKDALTVARQNAKKHQAEITFLNGDLFEPLIASDHESFDLIVSNPPYVNLETVDQNTPITNSLRFEPRMALYADDNGFTVVQKIIEQAPIWLKADGTLLIEIGDDQGSRASEAAQRAFPEKRFEIKKDLAGRDRLLVVSTT